MDAGTLDVRPVVELDPLVEAFARQVRRLNELLAPMGARLMPGGMHPWMDPHQELKLWPHEYSPVYEAYDRIFSCNGHGWANLQSTHVNLPFGSDAEFGRLHAAIRLVLPIIPALAASSPFVDGAATGTADTRLSVYQRNAKRVPSVTGEVIPEPVFGRREYQERILDRMYRDIAPHDPDEILRHEWLNARGAIARFDRGSIEIRLIDAQECPSAEIAVVALVAGAVRGLVEGRWGDLAAQQAWSVASLRRILQGTVRDAEAHVIDNRDYLGMFGLGAARAAAGELWRHLAAALTPEGAPWADAARVIVDEGPLARRIARAAGPAATRERLAEVYRELCGCLQDNRPFAGVGVER